VSFASCWFVARGEPVDVLRERAERLAALYGRPLSVFRVGAGGFVVGAIGGSLLAWGDGAVGPGSSCVEKGGEVVVRAARIDVASLYAAADRAWSSHAVAAAVLAYGCARVRPESLGEMLAFDHPIESVVDGVLTVRGGSEVRVGGAGVVATRAPCPALSLVGESTARVGAAEALEAYAARLPAGRRPVFLGLSGGLDSRVAAAALRRAGVPFVAYTWGAEDEAEVATARAVARALGAEHRLVPARWLPDAEGLREAVAASSWSDGAVPFGFAAPAPGALPDGAVNVTGTGGELGRAYHYALVARNRRSPSLRQLRAAWRPEHGLPEPARSHVASVADGAVRAALGVQGVSGWRALDLVYWSLRMRWWVRSGIRATGGTLVPLFLDPRVASALVSLPLEDRLRDGFHRWYLESFAPELRGVPLPPARSQRPGVPAPVRRLARVVRELRPAARSAEATAVRDLRAQRPATFADVRDEVLASPLVSSALGTGFARELLARFERGEPAAVEAALVLAAPVSLAASLRAAGLAG
jgi:Asparagine synthase